MRTTPMDAPRSVAAEVGPSAQPAPGGDFQALLAGLEGPPPKTASPSAAAEGEAQLDFALLVAGEDEPGQEAQTADAEGEAAPDAEATLPEDPEAVTGRSSVPLDEGEMLPEASEALAEAGDQPPEAPARRVAGAPPVDGGPRTEVAPEGGALRDPAPAERPAAAPADAAREIDGTAAGAEARDGMDQPRPEAAHRPRPAGQAPAPEAGPSPSDGAPEAAPAAGPDADLDPAPAEGAPRLDDPATTDRAMPSAPDETAPAPAEAAIEADPRPAVEGEQLELALEAGGRAPTAREASSSVEDAEPKAHRPEPKASRGGTQAATPERADDAPSRRRAPEEAARPTPGRAPAGPEVATSRPGPESLPERLDAPPPELAVPTARGARLEGAPTPVPAPAEAPTPGAARPDEPEVGWRLFRKGELQQAEVRIQHPTLGPMTLEMTMENGDVDLHVLTRSLLGALSLRREEGDLRDLLKKRGARLTRFEVEARDDDERPAPRTRPEPRAPHHPYRRGFLTTA
jgi:hypothetical protein